MSPAALSGKNGWKLVHKISRNVMKSYRFQIPKYDMPIRLRPWFLVFTCVVMIILAFLGFTNLDLPLNDKLLHFLCFCLATGVFYFIVDVEEDARRIWIWRQSGLIFTGFICFFCGGILSEVIQSLLPYKVFQFGDVVANLLGSSVGLFVAYHLERHYRHRREIARLYQPINTSLSDLEDDEESTSQLLPLQNSFASVPKGNKNKSRRLADVWDEQEELFGIGGDSDEDEIPGPAPSSGPPQPLLPEGVQVPKILISSS